MPTDFSKFPFTGIETPHADSLTEAIRYAPVDRGYVVVTLKTGSGIEFAGTVRRFAAGVRERHATVGVRDIAAYREARPDEFGGAMPFDQAICDQAFDDVKRRHQHHPDRWPATRFALQMLHGNDMADWIVLVECDTEAAAAALARQWSDGDEVFAALVADVQAVGVNSFRNTMRYAHVSRDPDVIQFFNLFPGPGDQAVLWDAWQEALPWFFETGEVRSSFPLVALDGGQPLLIVNYAHFDSLKHFFLGVAFDPNFIETIQRCYADRGFHLPLPFFGKIVPV